MRAPHRQYTGSRPRLALVGSAATVTLLLAGCTTGATGTASSAASSPAPGTSGTATAGEAGPSASASPSALPTGTPTASSSASPTGSLRSAQCASVHLTASLAPGGAAAGSVYPDLVLTNTGTQRCTLQGWPGVSFVGDGNGTQLGAAGDFDRSSPHGTVTLEPGGAAHAPLRIANALNYDPSACDPVQADGLRVYPPGETNALFVADPGLTACRSGVQHLITVQALLPGAS